MNERSSFFDFSKFKSIIFSFKKHLSRHYLLFPGLLPLGVSPSHRTTGLCITVHRLLAFSCNKKTANLIINYDFQPPPPPPQLTSWSRPFLFDRPRIRCTIRHRLQGTAGQQGRINATGRTAQPKHLRLAMVPQHIYGIVESLLHPRSLKVILKRTKDTFFLLLDKHVLLLSNNSTHPPPCLV